MLKVYKNQFQKLNIFDSDLVRGKKPRLPTNSGQIIKDARIQVFEHLQSKHQSSKIESAIIEDKDIMNSIE